MTIDPTPGDERIGPAYLLSLIIAVLTGICIGLAGAAAAIYVIWVVL